LFDLGGQIKPEQISGGMAKGSTKSSISHGCMFPGYIYNKLISDDIAHETIK
jgi:hypothetical protein